MEKDDILVNFEKRIGRFGRVRRGVANAARAYAAGTVVLGVGIAALLLLNGWITNPFVNAALVLAGAGVLVRALIRLGRQWEWRRSTLSEAFHLEALANDLNSRVISAVDFAGWSARDPMAEAVIRKAGQDLERPFEQLIDRTERNRTRVRFVLLLVFFLILGFTGLFSFSRMIRTVAQSSRELREFFFPTRYELFPGVGPHVYKLGSSVDVGLRFTRFGYPEVTMITSKPGKDGETRTVLKVDASGMAAVKLAPPLEEECRIRFAFGRRMTETTTVVFASAPVIENMQTELVYPLYTRWMPKEMEGIQDRVTALQGTRVSLGFSFSKPLNWAVLTFDDGQKKERVPLDVVGRFASVSFVHSVDRRGTLEVEDVHGFSLAVPFVMEFTLAPDNPPRLIIPKEITQDMPRLIEQLGGFSVGVRVEDDFGAAKCVLKWSKSTVKDKSRELDKGEVERLFMPPRPVATMVFESIFLEQAKSAMAGDYFTFQIVAYDNCAPKAHSTVSSVFSIFVYQEDLSNNMPGGGPVIDPGTGGPRGPRGPLPPKLPSSPGADSWMVQKIPKTSKGGNTFQRDPAGDTRREPAGGSSGSGKGYMSNISGAK